MNLHFRKSSVEGDPLVILKEVMSVLKQEELENICFLYMAKKSRSYLYAVSKDPSLLGKLGQSGYIFINSFDPREYTIYESWTCVGKQDILD